MSTFNELLTEKMQLLFMDIVDSLVQLPLEQRTYFFGYEDEEDYDLIYSVACYIALEYIKYSSDYSDPQYSLRHFLHDPDNESLRKQQQRTMKYAMEHKAHELEIKGEITENDKFAYINMDNIRNKLRGYRITEINFFELQNIHDLEIVKAIVERRIVSSKKISNSRFLELFEQYDAFVESLIDRSKVSDKDMVFSSLALFTFEWHYPIELFYFLSCFMEKEEIATVDQDTLLLLCGNVSVESRFGGWFSTESRMIKERIMISSVLFGKGADKFARETLREMFKEVLVLVTKYKELKENYEGVLYKDWFRKESSIADWASFFKYYNIFSIWQKKEWTPKRIQKMRYLFELSLYK